MMLCDCMIAASLAVGGPTGASKEAQEKAAAAAEKKNMFSFRQKTLSSLAPGAAAQQPSFPRLVKLHAKLDINTQK